MATEITIPTASGGTTTIVTVDDPVVELPILHDLPSHRYRIQLGGVSYVVRLTYRDRLASWYLDLYDVDEEPIALGRRLSPRFSPLLGIGVDRGPSGLLYVEGPDRDGRDTVRLYHIDPTALVATDTVTLAVSVDP